MDEQQTAELMKKLEEQAEATRKAQQDAADALYAAAQRDGGVQ
ncbi:hypothetical protein [Streptomyces goshikiensis]